MAIIEVKVPQLSESVAEATLLQWKKKPGEAVAIDEILIEIETDKVVLEVPAPAAGVLAQLVKNDCESCVSDEVIAKIDTEGKEAVSPLEVKPVPDVKPAPGAASGPAGAKGDVAMPAAAKLLAENQLGAGQVAGSGKDGRVTKGDVQTALQAGVKAAAPAVAAPAAAVVSVPVAPSVAKALQIGRASCRERVS
jgi:2-oxoglutarate dehydrogenase E2 component (dihydrolipoamide succinyltransferase)